MTNLFTGPGRWVLVLLTLWALLGQHVFIHHLGGSGLELPFNAVTWLWVGAIFIVGAGVIKPSLVTSQLGRCLVIGAILLWLPMFYSATLGAEHSSDARWQALPRLLGLSAGVVFYWVLQQCRFNEQQRYFVLCLLLGLITVQIGFGLVQFFLLPADNWFNFNTRVRLPYGIFMQRNVMSSLVGSGVLLALYLLVSRAGRSWQWWLWCSLVAGAGIILVVLLQSRAGLYSLLAGLALLLPVCWRRLQSPVQRGVLLALMLAGALLGVWLLVYFNAHRRVLATYGELGVRYEIWRTTLSLISQYIGQGIGYGYFEPAYYAEAVRLQESTGVLARMGGNLHHPHNELLLWWVEGGLVALSAWLIWGWALWRVAGRLILSERLAMIALSLPLLAHIMSEYPLGHSATHWLWLLILLWYFDARGTASINAMALDRISLAPVRVVQAGLVLVGSAIMIYMASGLQTAYQLTQYERGKFSEPSRLAAALNPWFWADRQALYHHSLVLKQGITEHNLPLIREYLAWSTPVIARLPRATLLHNHLVALQMLGKTKEAQRLANTLQQQYPTQRLFSDAALKRMQTEPRVYHHLTQQVGAATYY